MSAQTSETANTFAMSNGKRGSAGDDVCHIHKKIRRGVSANIIAELTDCNASLSQQHKRRQDLIATGGEDPSVVFFNRTSGEISLVPSQLSNCLRRHCCC